MNFKDFLLESKVSDGSYKTEIDLEKAKVLLKKHCSKMNFDEPFYRGMRGRVPSYILEGNKGTRKSIDQSNHYTLLIDNAIQKNHSSYPLRSKAVIATNDIDISRQYGNNIYMLFPYDDVLIGTIDRDIWGTIVTINTTTKDIISWNEIYQACNIKADSAEGIIKDIEKILQTPMDELNKPQLELLRVFTEDMDDIDDISVEGELEVAYNPENLGFGLFNTHEIGFDNTLELWFSGKCIALHSSVYEQLVEDGFKI